MKFIIWTLIILALVSGAYYFFFNDPTAASSTESFFQSKPAFLGKLQQKSSDILGGAANVISGAKDKTGQAKDFLVNSEQAISSTIGQISDGAKSILPQGALDIISGKSSLGGTIFSQNSAAGSQELDICSVFKKGSTVNFAIGNPFSPKQGYGFEVSWGDGASQSGHVSVTDPDPIFSHVYSLAGNYAGNFMVTSASGTLSSEISLCVK